jgi:hypothetical protein
MPFLYMFFDDEGNSIPVILAWSRVFSNFRGFFGFLLLICLGFFYVFLKGVFVFDVLLCFFCVFLNIFVVLFLVYFFLFSSTSVIVHVLQQDHLFPLHLVNITENTVIFLLYYILYFKTSWTYLCYCVYLACIKLLLLSSKEWNVTP